MLDIYWWSLITMIFIVTGSVHSQTCNSTAIIYDLNTCTQQYGDPAQLQYVHTVCQNVECYLQCVSDAVGNCYMNDEFVSYNIPKQIVTTRAICSNLNLYYDGLYNYHCNISNNTCLVERNFTALTTELAAVNATTHPTQYKNAYCQLNTVLLMCLNVQPNNNNCSTNMIEFFTNLYSTSYSENSCNLSENNPYFTTYAGALYCSATNPSNQTTSYTTSQSNTTVDQSSNTTTWTLTNTTTDPITTTSVWRQKFRPTGPITTTSILIPKITTTEPMTAEPRVPDYVMYEINTTPLYMFMLPHDATTSILTPNNTTTDPITTTTKLTSQYSSTSSPTTSTMETTSQISTMSHSTPSTQQSTTQAPNQECSWQQLTSYLAGCHNISAGQFTTSYEDVLTSFCDNIECHIQCYTEAVGDCYLEDQAFFFDPIVYKVITRAYCRNVTETINAFTYCVMNDITCLQTYLSSVNSIFTSAQTSNDFASFAANYCSAISTYDSCVSFPPGGDCTPSYASLMKYTQTVSVSYKRCSAQNHGYFFTYGDELACGGSAITPYCLLLFVAILSFLQFNNLNNQ